MSFVIGVAFGVAARLAWDWFVRDVLRLIVRRHSGERVDV